MSVLIKNMEMPNSCSQCEFCLDGLRNDHDEICTGCMVMPDDSPWGCGYLEIDGIDHTKQRMYFCPLVALPEKHGRLIDADALADDLEYDAQHFDDDHELKFNAAMWLRSNQNKVIIEAER